LKLHRDERVFGFDIGLLIVGSVILYYYAAGISLLLTECKEKCSTMEAKLSSEGQATIPKAVRERLQISAGDRFKFFFHPDGVILLPRIPTMRLKGSLPKLANPVSLQEIDKAIESGATARFRRKK
jgi:AbrB family looped-hinge helix DNA binding protein